MEINEIVKKAGKTHAEVSRAMFPDNKRPYMAYWRMISKKVPMNEKQLIALSEATGYSIIEILEMRKKEA